MSVSVTRREVGRRPGRAPAGPAIPAAARLAAACLVAALLGLPSAPALAYETRIPDGFLPSGQGVTVDADGNAYVIASYYPDETHLEVLVHKLGPDGSVLWTTILPGAGHDFGTAIALDRAGDVLITGFTDSADFPVTPDALDADLTGFRDVFLVRLAAADGAILYGTFLGGDYVDTGHALAVGPDGDIYLAGATESTDFPTTADALQGSPSAPLYVYSDAFLTRLTAAGDSILYSTYLGGYSDDEALAVALAADGGIVLAGRTSADDFPLAAPLQSAPDDLFVARLSPDGHTLEFGTYLGGQEHEALGGMVIGPGGDVYLAGTTTSPDLPTTAGAFQPLFAGAIDGCGGGGFGQPIVNCDDGFVLALATDGGGLRYGTYLGGTGIDEIRGLAVDGAGGVHLVGKTVSDDFPGGGSGLFLAAGLTPAGDALAYTRRLSTNGGGQAVAVAPDGLVHVTGAVDFPAVVYVATVDRAQSLTGATTRAAPGSAARIVAVGPNPFNPRTEIRYELAAPARVTLVVHDLRGRPVRALARGFRGAGTHVASWDGRDEGGRPLPAGVYVCRLQAAGRADSRRLLLLK